GRRLQGRGTRRDARRLLRDQDAGTARRGGGVGRAAQRHPGGVLATAPATGSVESARGAHRVADADVGSRSSPHHHGGGWRRCSAGYTPELGAAEGHGLVCRTVVGVVAAATGLRRGRHAAGSRRGRCCFAAGQPRPRYAGAGCGAGRVSRMAAVTAAVKAAVPRDPPRSTVGSSASAAWTADSTTVAAAASSKL